MTRKFIHLSYKGTHFSGWQIQPNAPTIQDEIEKALSLLYNSKIDIVGCGRTDAGVHASKFYCHCDLEGAHFKNAQLAYKLNGILHNDIAIHEILDVQGGSHTRFDATSRSYIYKIHFHKDPFLTEVSFKFNQAGKPDVRILNEAVQLLIGFDEFYPFCKAHAQNDTYLCDIQEARWKEVGESLHFHISANRFLRGMVRLIVGMSLNVASGKLSLNEVREAMEKQERLKHAWSVPAEGLFLTDIKYPYL